MPTVGVATVPELDAAEALLELQSESRQSPTNGGRLKQSRIYPKNRQFNFPFLCKSYF